MQHSPGKQRIVFTQADQANIRVQTTKIISFLNTELNLLEKKKTEKNPARPGNYPKGDSTIKKQEKSYPTWVRTGDLENTL